MLDQLRRSSRSVVIWLIFGVIIAAFVLFFGPQAGPDMLGCGAGRDVAVTVDRSDVTAHSWRFAMNGLGFGSGSGPQAYERRHTAIDFLVERELLANGARRAGFRVSDDLVNERIKNGQFRHLGRHGFLYQDEDGRLILSGGRELFFRDGIFDYDLLTQLSHQLGLPSVGHFIEEQRSEYLAEAMRDLLLASVQVSEEEALSAYIHENTTVSLDYVKFEVAAYAAALKLSDADLRSFADKHPEEVTQAWERERARWESDEEWVKVRHVFLRKDGGDPDAAGLAQKVRERIVSGEELSDLALEVSEDERSKHRGGDLGWRPADSIGFGQELVDAVAELADGVLSNVVESQTGFHIFRVEERHKGSLTLDQKRIDLAAEIAPTSYGRELARRDAEAALAAAREQPLEELFERATAAPMRDLPPGMTQEDLDRIMRQLQEGTPPAPAPEDGAAPGAGDSPGDPPTDGDSDGAEEPAPGGDGAGEQGFLTPDRGAVREGPNILAQAGGEPVVVEPPEPARPPPGAELPQPVGLEKPKLRRLSFMSQSEFLGELGRSSELARDLFTRLEEGKVADRIYRVEDGEGFVVVLLTDRSDADLESFEETKAQRLTDLRQARGVDVLYHWIEDECRAAGEAGDVRVNPAYLLPEEDSKLEDFPYHPCQTISHRSVASQLATRSPLPAGGF